MTFETDNRITTRLAIGFGLASVGMIALAVARHHASAYDLMVIASLLVLTGMYGAPGLLARRFVLEENVLKIEPGRVAIALRDIDDSFVDAPPQMGGDDWLRTLELDMCSPRRRWLPMVFAQRGKEARLRVVALGPHRRDFVALLTEHLNEVKRKRDGPSLAALSAMQDTAQRPEPDAEPAPEPEAIDPQMQTEAT